MTGEVICQACRGLTPEEQLQYSASGQRMQRFASNLAAYHADFPEHYKAPEITGVIEQVSLFGLLTLKLGSGFRDLDASQLVADAAQKDALWLKAGGDGASTNLAGSSLAAALAGEKLLPGALTLGSKNESSRSQSKK